MKKADLLKGQRDQSKKNYDPFAPLINFNTIL